MTKDYVFGWEYTNGKLEAIYNAEGRNYNTNVNNASSTIAMRYEYNITDHLGNVRLSYTDKDNDGVIEQASGEVLTETHYYPFGMNMDGPWITGGDNQYLYNGKELNTDFGLDMLDYGARWYDPSVGRWHSVDPLAERRIFSTTYGYVLQNPILRFDPNGLTDYSINPETGEVTQVGDVKEGGDRVLKTNGKGKVKYYKRKSKRGQAKVEFNVAEGILEDGMNLKKKPNLIDVGTKGAPSVNDVEEFALNLSEYINKEIGGTYYSKDGSSDITNIGLGSYKINESDRVRDMGQNIGTMDKENHADYKNVGNFHTQPAGISLESPRRLRPSPADKVMRDNLLNHNPNARVYMIVRPVAYGTNSTVQKIEFTKPPISTVKIW